MKISSNEICSLVEKGIAHMTSPPKNIPTQLVVDAPILGNGDLGAAVGGDGAKQVFYLGKNDFWTQAHLGETAAQHQDRLLNKEGRRTGSRIVAAGWLEVTIPQLEGAPYKVDQDPYLAEVRGDFKQGKAHARFTSFICAVQNTLVVEVENSGQEPLNIQFKTMPGTYHAGNEVYGYEDGIREDTVRWEYPAEPYGGLPGRRWVYAGVTSDAETIYTPEVMARKGGSFTLAPGADARIMLTMLSNLDAPNALEETHRLCVASRTGWQQLKAAHRKWWQDYWARSIVKTGSDILDGYYYSSLYIIASAVRAGKVPPGLFGPWITVDDPKWTGSYTLNYNYESPFYCLYTCNRQHLAESYIEPLLDIIPVGQMYAKEKFGRPGIALPVEIGPWGMVCSALFHNQKTNAAYCCTNIFMHYFSTRDEDWGRRAYPFVREVADFWEADLVWEKERSRYSVVKDSAHEEYSRKDGEKNNTHALGLIQMVFRDILKMSEELGLDANRREKWAHIRDNLAQFPTFERNGKTVFRYNEEDYAWRDVNGTPVKFIYPCGCVGFESDPEILQIARDTLEQKENLFDNGNAFCEYTVMCARVGREPKLLYDKLIWACQKRGMQNKYIFHGGGGIEDCSGVTSGINEMMMQSHEDIIRIFPVWDRATDAAFTNLRAYGAFTVSSSITGGQVDFVQIESEKGRQLTIDIPWSTANLTVNGQNTRVINDKRATIDTNPGDVLYLVKGI